MVDSWHEKCPEAQFFTLQGSSESTACALTGGLFRKWEDIPNEDGRYVGKIMAFGTDIKLVDDDDKEVPIGQPGEQIIRGPLVLKGYYKNEEKTKEAFRGGWFHTGDVLMADAEGSYFFVDRKKDMVKTGGENVSTEEVEGVINAHPKVLQCAVFGITHPYWGEAVTAAIIPKEKEELTEDEIISFCKERVSGYKVPKYAVITDSLPMTSVGKLLKRELRKIYKDLAERA
jgi:Acyl-CoA synthetases (AMP-forming)/AMP-acid ligases II